jgi:hypothetical protein
MPNFFKEVKKLSTKLACVEVEERVQNVKATFQSLVN